MIMSGWILPDLFEVKCISCSGTNEHMKVVKSYLDNLKTRDCVSYAEILHEFYRLYSRQKVLNLEDFAVAKLGWIKLINSPIKVVFYSPESPLELLVDRYSRLGYYPIATYDNLSIINIHIPSKELI